MKKTGIRPVEVSNLTLRSCDLTKRTHSLWGEARKTEGIPKPECYVFPSGTPQGFSWDRKLKYERAHQIVKTTTGKFLHWFRSIYETIYGRLVFKKDAWKLKEFMSLKTFEFTNPYVGGSWEENEREIFNL